MEVIVILIPLAILLGMTFVLAFIWSARRGQYDDLETPRFRMLLDDQIINRNTMKIKKDEE